MKKVAEAGRFYKHPTYVCIQLACTKPSVDGRSCTGRKLTSHRVLALQRFSSLLNRGRNVRVGQILNSAENSEKSGHRLHGSIQKVEWLYRSVEKLVITQEELLFKFLPLTKLVLRGLICSSSSLTIASTIFPRGTS